MRGAGVRVAALVLALTFQGVAAADALALHPCPHHTTLSAPTDESAASPAHGAHHTGDGVDAPHEDGAGHGEHAGPCTCVGSCQAGGTSGVLAATNGLVRQAPFTMFAPDVVAAADEALPSLPPHFLPFSNGPPRAF